MTLIGTHMTLWPCSIGCDQSLARASELMREHSVRHLPVLKGGQLVGVLSERDIALVEALAPTDPSEVTVEEAMTPEPYSVGPDMPLQRVVHTMYKRKYGCAVVVDNGRVVGLFTTTDALRLLYSSLAKEEPASARPKPVTLDASED